MNSMPAAALLKRAVTVCERCAAAMERSSASCSDGRAASLMRSSLTSQSIAADSGYANAHFNLAVLYELYLQRPDLALEQYVRFRELTVADAAVAEVDKWIIDLQAAQRGRGAGRATGGQPVSTCRAALQSPGCWPGPCRPVPGTRQWWRLLCRRPGPARPAASPRGLTGWISRPTSIRGNQELPKVLYIVPWKEPGLAEPAGRPLNSLVDEALAPVDREVFRRQLRYFDQLYAGPGGALGAAGPEFGELSRSCLCPCDRRHACCVVRRLHQS